MFPECRSSPLTLVLSWSPSRTPALALQSAVSRRFSQLRAASMPHVMLQLCAANMQAACCLSTACTQQALCWLRAASIPQLLFHVCLMRWPVCMISFVDIQSCSSEAL